jgi:hypothetical protein
MADDILIKDDEDALPAKPPIDVHRPGSGGFRGGGPKIGRIPKGRVRINHVAGPNMSVLTPLQQRFVESFVSSPMRSAYRSLLEAGYKGTEAAGRRQSHRLLQNEVIQAAIQEVADVKMKLMVPKSLGAIEGVLADPKHRDHIRASFGILDRTGHHGISETKTTVAHTFDVDDMKAKLRVLLTKPAIKALLPGSSGPASVVEAEFIEVAEPTDD